MSIPLVNTWGANGELTSGQLNQLATYLTQVVDKRSGQTDTIQSVVSCASAGRIVESYAAGADANTTYTVGGGNAIINAASGLTISRTYTLSVTGAVSGDKLTVIGGPLDVVVKDGSTNTTMATVGTSATCDAQVIEFYFNGTRWNTKLSGLAPAASGRTAYTTQGASIYTVPPGVFKLLVIGCGGGGGGGGGSAQDTDGSGRSSTGGGGGGAAQVGYAEIDTTPGTAYTVTIPAAAAGGAGGTSTGTPASNGSDGGDVTFGSVATFRGAQGGNGGCMIAGNPVYALAPGGGPLNNSLRYPGNPQPPVQSVTSPGVIVTAPHLLQMLQLPGFGGCGGNIAGGGTSSGAGASPQDGARCCVSATVAGSGTTTPGSAGTPGLAGTSSSRGGGAGGGGAASSFGNGGNGGNGTTGLLGTAAGVGAVGGACAGGGGGAGAATVTVGSATGGAGGAGGLGVCIVIPLR